MKPYKQDELRKICNSYKEIKTSCEYKLIVSWYSLVVKTASIIFLRFAQITERNIIKTFIYNSDFVLLNLKLNWL